MSDIFTLEALPAGKGDSLILHFGPTDAPRLAVIDGGPSGVWNASLRPRLNDIRVARSLAMGVALPINLLMISHIDDDHIKGILDFANELKADKDLQRPPFAEVATLWHNSFDGIIGNDELSDGTVTATASMGFNDFPEGTNPDTAFILSSVRQGRDLRNFAESLNWKVNTSFETLILMHGADDDPIDRFGGGLTLDIIGPRKPEIDALQARYDDFLINNGLGRDSVEAMLATRQDKSVPNLSSIVALANLGGKRILLTGDALGSKITNALVARGLAAEDAPLKVDVLKMPHHGSDRNVTPEFFRLIKADHYVFSGDGAHGNPERATVEMLFAEQDAEPITLHFTHTVDDIDTKRHAVAESHGHHWTEADHSIGALLQNEIAGGRAFTVSEPTDRTGVVIHLLDPLEIPRHDH